MTTDSTYNGWRNYETWCVKLWLDNEQGSYTECTDRAREVLADHTDDDEQGTPQVDKDTAVRELADWLKEYLD